MKTKEGSRYIPGLNVQAPWAGLLAAGKKTVETRTYPLPKHYLGNEIAIVETPGKARSFHRRIIAIAIFGDSFRYNNRTEFEQDYSRHLVTRDSEFSWKSEKKKWGWPILSIRSHPQDIPGDIRGGIVYYQRLLIHAAPLTKNEK